MGVIRAFRLLFRAALAVYLLTFAAVVWQARSAHTAYANGSHLPEGSATAVVLGSGVKGDGILDYAARGRVRLGVQLLAEGKVRQIVMTGGPVRAWHKTAAEVMAEYALQLGAPPTAVLLEPASRTTFENLMFAQDMLADAEDRRVVIVTNDFHLPRAEVLAGLLDIEVAGLAAVAMPATVGQELGMLPLLREAGAWWMNLFRMARWRLNGKHWPRPQS